MTVFTKASFGASLAAGALMIAGPAAAQQPMNAAQANYKRCPVEAMTRGVQIVEPFCGVGPTAPVFGGYDFDNASLATVQSGAQTLRQHSAAVAAYQTCINTRVMGDGSLSTETLDFAACAHQWAGEQLTQTTVMWGESCLAYEDKTQTRYTTPCFPAG